MRYFQKLSPATLLVFIFIHGISADTTASGENETVALNTTAQSSECPGIPRRFYDELDCKPVFNETNDLCPIRYQCESFENAPIDMCHFRGEVYAPGSSVNNTGNPCDIECYCDLDEPTPDYNITKMAVFRCAEVDCPLEEEGPFDEDGNPRKCVPKKNHDECCASDTVCDDEEEETPNSKSLEFDNQTRANQSQKLARCMTADNKTYIEGQEFYLNDAPCKACICQPGYTAGETGEPWCREVRCSTLVGNTRRIRDGCVPIYFDTGRCCPIDFRCPNAEHDTVISDVLIKIAPNPDETCKFGDLFLRTGDRLSPDPEDRCVECECEVPPYLTCQKKANC